MTQFAVGDRVWWTSQAGGHRTTKVGHVVGVVPANSSIEGCVPPGERAPDTSVRYQRNHESYLVKVPGAKRLYWPVVSMLQRSTEQ